MAEVEVEESITKIKTMKNGEIKLKCTKKSEKQNKKDIKRISSPVDNICRNIELLAIQSNREYNALIEKQKEMLKDDKTERSIKEKRIEEIYKIQQDLRKKFLETNDFIKQCQQKEIEAEKKIENEKKLQNEIKMEIEKYKKDIQELKDIKTVLEENFKEFEPYEKVMEEVVKDSKMSSARECMDRCDALMLAQDEITELERTNIKAIEEIRNEIVKATNDASLTVLGLNNKLAKLGHLYNAARTECMRWEKVLAETKDVIISNELKTSLCINSINQMYRLLCKRNGWDDTCPRENVEKQLDLIKSEIEILQKVVKLCENEK